MKKLGSIFGATIIIIAVFLFANKLYYPSLPVKNLSAKEAIGKLDKSDNKVVELAVEDDAVWYMTRSGKEGILGADENIKRMIAANGWEFIEKDGSGLFFGKDGERLIANTQMWTKKYVLIKVQIKFISP